MYRTVQMYNVYRYRTGFAHIPLTHSLCRKFHGPQYSNELSAEHEKRAERNVGRTEWVNLFVLWHRVVQQIGKGEEERAL